MHKLDILYNIRFKMNTNILPEAEADDFRVWGMAFGISVINPLSFKVISLQAILNSARSSFPSLFMSANSLKTQLRVNNDTYEDDTKKISKIYKLSNPL